MSPERARIKTTVVGSYPYPDWLGAFPSEQSLIDATRVVLHVQEQCGIDLVCDGELYRFDVNHPEAQGMIEYFLRPLDGFRGEMSFDELTEFRKQPGMSFRKKPPGVVDAALRAGRLDLGSACNRARHLTAKPFKFTLTGPHMLSKTVINKHYPDTPALAHAIADILAQQVKHLDADVVQIDEANLPGSPDEWKWASAALNKVLDAVPSTPAVHLCFGNYGGQVTQRGTWSKLIDYLNSLHADHVILELAHRPPEDLMALKDLRPDLGVGIGVVDIKATEVESADTVARRMERAAQALGEGRIAYVHPDCGFWNLKRHMADAKMKALVDGRDLYSGVRDAAT